MAHYKTEQEKMMADWWQSPLGQNVLLHEKPILQSLSQHFHGYYQLQVGSENSQLPSTPHASVQKIMSPFTDVHGHNEALPFKCYSLDTVLLNHVLEFSDDPHQVLREAERILVADGVLILCSFNPWSLWGLRRLFSWQDQPPWQGHFFTQMRIKDWLKLLNFDIVESKKCIFQPPFRNEKWFNKCSFLSRWGRRLWPFFSGVTIVVATKRTIPLTPVAKRWKPKKILPTGSLITKPATRLFRENEHE